MKNKITIKDFKKNQITRSRRLKYFIGMIMKNLNPIYKESKQMRINSNERIKHLKKLKDNPCHSAGFKVPCRMDYLNEQNNNFFYRVLEGRLSKALERCFQLLILNKNKEV